ncbi:Ig-like domain-containing protein [Geomonas sp. RF6]|uniref:Ig-like domain-containing protein n=1 Tax=Geomonas sp. RF6 TaxID=2897342 RepID=UPI001E60D7D7|nr:Ig-like domain-containing protein [Geomonas sp. RF6]UFS69120.1 Ig-like domain-containing protein [Geomonas sp. RF6]
MARTKPNKISVKISLLYAVLQLLLTFCFFPSASFAASVVLDWDPSTDADLAGYKVYYQANSSALPFGGSGADEGSAPLDVKNVTSTTISGLDPSNSYYFAVTAYNSVGTESVYSNIIEIKEAVAPSITVTAPSTTAIGTVTIGANASDNAGVTAVRFFVNGEMAAEKSSAPYSFEWNTASLTPGSYSISAKAYDAAGNEGTSDVVVVTVAGDTVKPAVSVVAPTAPLSGMVALSASATDNTAVAAIELQLDGAVILTGNQSPVSYTLDSSAVANGSHQLCAKAYDVAGNAGDACVSLFVNNPVVDSIPPVISAFGMPASAGALNVPIESFSATDNVAVTGYLVTESADPPAGNGEGWSASAPASFRFAAPGTHTAFAWAKDAAGNVSAAGSATVTITLPDTTAPAVSLTLSNSGSTVSGTVNVSLAATDDTAVARLVLYVNGKMQGSSNMSSFNMEWNSTSVADGSYTFTAKAFDAAGNAGEAVPVTVTVSNVRELSLLDALTALQVACAKIIPNAEQVTQLDVAPVVGGKSAPDGKIDAGDVLVILSRVVGKK